MAEDKAKENRSVVIVGVIILTLSVAAILLTVFVPRARNRGELHDRVARALSSPIYETVIDPDYRNEGDLMGNAPGREVALDAATWAEVSARFSEITENARGGETEHEKLGGYALCLRVRTEQGTEQFYFTKTDFFFVKDGRSYRFKAKDAGEYDELFRLLERIVNA